MKPIAAEHHNSYSLFTVYRFSLAFIHSLTISPESMDSYRVITTMFTREMEDQALVNINRIRSQGHIQPVATVSCDTIDDAFRLTNHLTNPWYENDGVELLDGNDLLFLNSSSVGHLFSDKDGNFFLTAMSGFIPLRANANGDLVRLVQEG